MALVRRCGWSCAVMLPAALVSSQPDPRAKGGDWESVEADVGVTPASRHCWWHVGCGHIRDGLRPVTTPALET